MSVPPPGTPAVLLGSSGLGRWLAAQPVRRAVIVVDPAVAGTAISEAVTDEVRSACSTVLAHVVTGPPTAGVVAQLAADWAETGADVVVGIGGGTVLDRAKLAIAMHADPSTRARVEHRQRSGWVTLPDTLVRRARLVAVPTTLGTGSELSAVACLDHDDGKRLVEGAVLRPDLALLDPRATGTLPGTLVVQGIFEALSRTMGPYVGSHRDDPGGDELAEAVARRLIALGRHAVALCSDGRPVDDEARHEVARLSGLSHTPLLALAREPFAYKPWFPATELSWAATVGKVPALAALLPPVWRVILSGDGRLGSPARLRRMWERIAVADPCLDGADPVEGLAGLRERWDLPSRVEPAEPEVVARTTLRRWGAGLPMLGRVDYDVLSQVITAATVG